MGPALTGSMLIGQTRPDRSQKETLGISGVGMYPPGSASASSPSLIAARGSVGPFNWEMQFHSRLCSIELRSAAAVRGGRRPQIQWPGTASSHPITWPKRLQPFRDGRPSRGGWFCLVHAGKYLQVPRYCGCPTDPQLSGTRVSCVTQGVRCEPKPGAPLVSSRRQHDPRSPPG